ncbi:SIMPL domain-containing protein [Qipengyuania sp.]|uniref:SIMPL domain-containing protein n=1 Tax=Qipengyuania sp. TaxID=2004515 RepID=UPI0035C848A3
MNRVLLPLAAAAAIASPAAAANVDLAAQGPLVELSVTETVRAKPDIANISAGVTTLAPTAVAAMEQNAKEMDAVVKRIKSLGIPADDIQTQGINLNAQYDYNQQTRKQIFRGYQASNRVSVTLRKVPDTGRILDALVAAGATDISGPDFSIDDDTAPRAQARKAAFDNAQKQAQEYARWAGYTGVRLLQVSENVQPMRPMPMMDRGEIVVTGAKVSTPVEPGLVGTSVTVTTTFEMTR